MPCVTVLMLFEYIANVLERPRAKFLNEHAFGSFKNAGDWILKDVRYITKCYATRDFIKLR